MTALESLRREMDIRDALRFSGIKDARTPMGNRIPGKKTGYVLDEGWLFRSVEDVFGDEIRKRLREDSFSRQLMAPELYPYEGVR